MVADVAALRRSPLWATYQHEMRVFLTADIADCSYDATADLTLVADALTFMGTDPVFVQHGLDYNKTIDCYSKLVSGIHVATIDGNFVTVTNQNDQVDLFTFVDGSTMVEIESPHPSVAKLTAALKRGAPLRRDAAFLATMSRVARYPLWAVARPNSSWVATMGQSSFGVSLRGFSVGVGVSDHVEVHTVLETATADDTDRVLVRLRPQLEFIRGYADHVDARADGLNVRIDVVIGSTQLGQLVVRARTALGASPH